MTFLTSRTVYAADRSPAAVEQVITERTKAILAVHLAGFPCEMSKLEKLCVDHSLILLEDAAHAIGSKYRGEMIGSGSKAASFSFHPAKNMTTIEGGALATNCSTIYERAKLLSFHGINRSAAERAEGEGRFWAYDVQEAGYKYNLSDVQAVIGRAQLARLDEMIEIRTHLVGHYKQRLAKIPHLILPADSKEHKHSHHLFYVRLRESASIARDELALSLRERNVGVGVHYIPIPAHSYYQRTFGWKLEDFPVCDMFIRGLFSLPLFAEMTLEEVDYVCDELESILTSR